MVIFLTKYCHSVNRTANDRKLRYVITAIPGGAINSNAITHLQKKETCYMMWA